MNLGALLKMLGIKVPPEVVKQIEAMIPQLPGKVQETIVLINAAVQNFDGRLRQIELVQKGHSSLLVSILEELHGQRNNRDSDDARPAGIGATQRELERVGDGFRNLG